MSTSANCFHYLIDKELEIENDVEGLANLKDNVDVCSSVREIEEKISKKALPNTVYDLGFVLIAPENKSSFNREVLRDGYYLVDFDEHYRDIDIIR